jgi:hypothetical protein
LIARGRLDSRRNRSCSRRAADLGLQDLSIHAGHLACPRDVEITHDRVGCCAHSRQETVKRPALLLELAEPACALQDLNLSLEDVDSVVELSLERAAPPVRTKLSWIFAAGRVTTRHGESLPQQLIACAKCRFESGPSLSYKRKTFRVYFLSNVTCISVSAVPERCDHFFDSGRHQSNSVEVAFHHECAIGAPKSRYVTVETVEQLALREYRRLGGV